jgi:hypothetical protein
MKVGDRVEYRPFDDNIVVGTYTIEKDYGNDVYFIGNVDSFVDCVSIKFLQLIE